jgi:hypothetical protein
MDPQASGTQPTLTAYNYLLTYEQPSTKYPAEVPPEAAVQFCGRTLTAGIGMPP